MYKLTPATKKVGRLKNRIRAVQGGTSASKTISILLLLINAAIRDKTATLTSIVSESLPHLKKGAIRDFLNIMQEHGYFEDARWNKTDFIYTFQNGSKIEFFSADQPSKVRGPRRDRLFINEANNVRYEAFDQLEIRTKEYIYLDWNPTVEFWWHEKNLQYRDDVDFEILTYLDNDALDERIVASIEAHRNDKAWWTVYGLGLLGDVETKIYKGWQIVDDVPHEARLERIGLDFGYSQDPAAIVAVYYYNGGYILDEISYQKGLSYQQIADRINIIPDKAMVVADSADPRGIDELKLLGVDVFPSVKGSGSVNFGIKWVQGLKISVTKRSVNLLNEYRKYVWVTDKNGVITDHAIDELNHAMDAIRYALASLRPRDPEPLPVELDEEEPLYPLIGI